MTKLWNKLPLSDFANLVRDYAIGPKNKKVKGWYEVKPGELKLFEIHGQQAKELIKILNSE